MTLRIFESVFYKSLIRACSFDNFLAASQNARSYGQTINHRALRICKKRIQKVLMLSPFILINSSSYLLSDLYNKTLPSNHNLVFFLNITDHCHFLICNMFLHDLACFFFLTCSDRIHKLFMLIQQYNMVICILYIFQTITVELFS